MSNENEKMNNYDIPNFEYGNEADDIEIISATSSLYSSDDLNKIASADSPEALDDFMVPIPEETPQKVNLDGYKQYYNTTDIENETSGVDMDNISISDDDGVDYASVVKPVIEEDYEFEEEEEPEISPEEAKGRFAVSVFEWVESAAFAVVVVILIFTFLFRIVGIDGKSMFPTLNDADRVIISNLFFTPQTGDIVVIDMGSNDVVVYGKQYSKPLIKRVIATGGQTVEVKNDSLGNQSVYVDGQRLEESYINFDTVHKSIPQDRITIPEGYVFVMGDNRGESLDSRMFGYVDERSIVGKAVFRIFPFNAVGELYE